MLAIESRTMRKAIPIVFLLVALGLTASALQRKPPFPVVEASISDMQQAMKEGRVTPREIVVQYLTRIAMYNKIPTQ
jgi:hypothetical protein